jgi:hypothetical protein
MKKIALIFSALLISSLGYSQDFLTGPKAKNAKAGTLNGPKISLVHQSAPETVQGPLAKNQDIWAKESSKSNVVFRKEINNPKGLQAKNQKPWERTQEVIVDTKAVYEEPKSMKPKKIWIH